MAKREVNSQPDSTHTPAAQIDIRLWAGQGTRRRDVLAAGRDLILQFPDPTRLVLALLSYALLLAALAGSIYWLSVQPSAMRGEFNVAVAEFREITKEDQGKHRRTVYSESLGQVVYDYLEGEYARTDFGLDVQIEHKNMPYVEGDSDARTLAQRTQADLVIYGTLTSEGETDVTSLSPRFYVARGGNSTRRHGVEIGKDVDELAGAHPFSLRLHASPESGRERLWDEVSTRAGILLTFSQGLIQLYSEQPKPARSAFVKAIEQASEQEEFLGSQVLYLFAATASMRLRDYRDAQNYLEQARALAPNYGRAHVARGNLYYAQAVDGYEDLNGCTTSWRPSETEIYCREGQPEAAWWALLYLAEEAYDLATRPEAQADYGAYAEEKGWLGQGNVHLLQAYKGEDLYGAYDRASDAYKKVIQSFDDLPHPDKHALAAHAYWGLGVARLGQGRIDQAREAFDQCTRVARSKTGHKQDCRDWLETLEAEVTRP